MFQRPGPLAQGFIATHESPMGSLQVTIPGYDPPVDIGRLVVASKGCEQFSQKKQRLPVGPPQLLLALQHPFARRHVLQEIAPVELTRLSQVPDRLIRCLLLQAARRSNVLLEGLHVVGILQRVPEGVATFLENHPLLGTQRPPQAEHGVVEGAAKLGRGGFRPEGEAYLLLGSTLGVAEQVVEQLAGLLDPIGGVYGQPFLLHPRPAEREDAQRARTGIIRKGAGDERPAIPTRTQFLVHDRNSIFPAKHYPTKTTGESPNRVIICTKSEPVGRYRTDR